MEKPFGKGGQPGQVAGAGAAQTVRQVGLGGLQPLLGQPLPQFGGGDTGGVHPQEYRRRAARSL